uniref:Uncharacterized protein n=1 Tax=Arundo donax TaxID=35708 RepID=A0A0A9AW51_ARUDO
MSNELGTSVASSHFELISPWACHLIWPTGLFATSCVVLTIMSEWTP